MMTHQQGDATGQNTLVKPDGLCWVPCSLAVSARPVHVVCCLVLAGERDHCMQQTL